MRYLYNSYVRLQDQSGQFRGIVTYLINLELRTDRLKSAITEANKAGLNLERVDATPAVSNPNTLDILSPPAFGCWDSHKRAMSEFLKTDNSFCIIAEDDFLITNVASLAKQIESINLNAFDFLQVGFLNTGLLDRMSRIFANFESLIFISCSRIMSRFPKISRKYSQRLRVRRSYMLSYRWVADDIRAGAHFYIISRGFAETASKLNDPAFLTADGFYMALAWDKHFKMARTRHSYVKQSNSPSSIKQPRWTTV